MIYCPYGHDHCRGRGFVVTNAGAGDDASAWAVRVAACAPGRLCSSPPCHNGRAA
jgi:hypothetical protein